MATRMKLSRNSVVIVIAVVATLLVTMLGWQLASSPSVAILPHAPIQSPADHPSNALSKGIATVTTPLEQAAPAFVTNDPPYGAAARPTEMQDLPSPAASDKYFERAAQSKAADVQRK